MIYTIDTSGKVYAYETQEDADAHKVKGAEPLDDKDVTRKVRLWLDSQTDWKDSALDFARASREIVLNRIMGMAMACTVDQVEEKTMLLNTRSYLLDITNQKDVIDADTIQELNGILLSHQYTMLKVLPSFAQNVFEGASLVRTNDTQLTTS